MLHEFLTSNRAELIERCRLKVAQRSAPRVTPAELTHGIPLFLDQLIKTLEVEQTSEPMRSRKASGPAGGGGPWMSEMATAAALHGRELLQQGFTMDQVVHDYGASGTFRARGVFSQSSFRGMHYRSNPGLSSGPSP
jgi:hypothetical protein